MPTHITSRDREPLSGLVERVTFHSPETGCQNTTISHPPVVAVVTVISVARANTSVPVLQEHFPNPVASAFYECPGHRRQF